MLSIGRIKLCEALRVLKQKGAEVFPLCSRLGPEKTSRAMWWPLQPSGSGQGIYRPKQALVAVDENIACKGDRIDEFYGWIKHYT